MLNIIRSLSSSSIVRQLIRPPVHVFGLEGSYAIALFSAATKLQQLDSIEKDFQAIKNELNTDTALKEMINNPSVKSSEMADAMKSMATKINLTSATTNLLIVLAENSRLQRLERIASAFSTIMAGCKGKLICHVTTAKPLDEEDKAQLDKILSSYAMNGQDVIIDVRVDPSLIGGMIVSAGDKHVDMSVATKIRKYTEMVNSSLSENFSYIPPPQPPESINSDCEEEEEKK